MQLPQLLIPEKATRLYFHLQPFKYSLIQKLERYGTLNLENSFDNNSVRFDANTLIVFPGKAT